MSKLILTLQIAFLIILNFKPISVSSQSSPKKFGTSVFVLNAAAPTPDSSFYSLELDSKGNITKYFSKKLEVSNRQFSSLKIENINPLRYYYFINNQLVSQFMDNTPTLFGNNITNQGNQLNISPISFLKLFDNQKNQPGNNIDTLSNQEKVINKIKDSIVTLQKLYRNISDEYYVIYDSLSDKLGKNFNSKTNSKMIAKTKQLNLVLDSFHDEYGLFLTNISVYENLINEKLFGLGKNGILQNFRIYNSILYQQNDSNKFHLHNDSAKTNKFNKPTQPNRSLNYQTQIDLKKQVLAISSFPDSLDQSIQHRSEILNLISVLETDSIFNNVQFSLANSGAQKYLYSRYSTRLIQIANLLQKYFSINLNFRNLNVLSDKRENDISADVTRLMEIFRIKKLLADYLFNMCEQFILKTTVDVGKLLQKQVFQLSRLKNDIQNYNYIDPPTIYGVDTTREQTKDIFSFVQSISADLSVYASAIQSNTKSFQPYLNNIDSNYLVILDYLKVFDFISKYHSTNDYTLPRTSNSANADLLRYTVSRIDKNTLATEDLTYDLWIKGGLKIDFSAGFFASGLNDNQYQKLLISHDSATTQDSIQIHRVNDGKYAFGFGGMVNLSLRTGASWITPGISFGFIYSTNQKLQIICGGALHLGKTERIILHAGMTMGTSKTFDDSQLKYTSNTIQKGNSWGLNVPNYNNYTIPALVDKFTVKPFFGLSYNLSKSGPFNALSESGQTKYNSLLLSPAASGNKAAQ